MISADFAPNEKGRDLFTALTLSFLPWKWKRGVYQKKITHDIESMFPGWSSTMFFSGRSALFHLLKELDLPQKSIVHIQAFSCLAVALPIIELQMNPTYIDIEPQTYSMEIKSLQSRVTSASRVVILQHSFGMAPKYRSDIITFCQKKNLILIEDLSHGYESVRMSKLTFMNTNHHLLLSFGRSKSLSSVFGGAVITRDPLLINRLNKVVLDLAAPSYWTLFRILLFKILSPIIQNLYDFGVGKILLGLWKKTPFFLLELSKQEKTSVFDFRSIDYEFSNAQATLLNTQMKHKKDVDLQRIQRCTQFQNVFHTSYPQNSPLIRFPLRVNNRESLLSHMKKRHIFLGTWYSQPVAPKEVDLKSVFYRYGSCPTAEKICNEIINLPTSISQSEADTIIKIASKHI